MNSSRRWIIILSFVTAILVAGVALNELRARPQQIELGVRGMVCDGCVDHLTRELKALPGVQSVSVSLEKERATVTLEPRSDIKTETIAEVVQRAGYEPDIGGVSARITSR